MSVRFPPTPGRRPRRPRKSKPGRRREVFVRAFFMGGGERGAQLAGLEVLAKQARPARQRVDARREERSRSVRALFAAEDTCRDRELRPELRAKPRRQFIEVSLDPAVSCLACLALAELPDDGHEALICAKNVGER